MLAQRRRNPGCGKSIKVQNVSSQGTAVILTFIELFCRFPASCIVSPGNRSNLKVQKWPTGGPIRDHDLKKRSKNSVFWKTSGSPPPPFGHVMRNRNVAFLMDLRQTSCCKRTSGIALCQVMCQVRRQKCQVSLNITVSQAPATAQFAQWRKGNISGIGQ
jgi:hypothetical protein